MKGYGSQLLLKTAAQSFWNTYFSIYDPFEGLFYIKPSTQKTETYARLGAAPMMTEWVGDKNAKDANEYSYSVTNKSYEATVRIDKDLVKYQQWDEISNLTANLGYKARQHRVKLATDLLIAGETVVCEDGQFFFDDDHSNAGAEYTTSQDNKTTSAAATATQPTDLEMAAGIRAMRDQFYSFKDDRGDPMAIDDRKENWVLMVPPVYASVGMQVQKSMQLTGPIGNDLYETFECRVNQYMTEVDTMWMFYKGSPHKPVIVQESGGIRLQDEEEFKTGDTLYSATWYGRVIYGQWRTACCHIYS